MRLAPDTIILAYAEGIGDETRCLSARKLVKKLTDSEVILPAQTLGELSRVLDARISETIRRVEKQCWSGQIVS